ncbi:hypothetical protein Aau02nite_42840 [Amorphoplanes auranticolor]|uniref:Uncharacterized protein n=1 Tax=Actinoplanes auranticolor TaxID=47988 RepID=A0A919SFT8_9ACTN|nr:hypothetical protein Aau02nite_42840 [Actinoplanes auranticolor]
MPVSLAGNLTSLHRPKTALGWRSSPGRAVLRVRLQWTTLCVAQALAAAQDTVEIRRRLARALPEAHEPDLATALNNLGLRLAGVGQVKQAGRR